MTDRRDARPDALAVFALSTDGLVTLAETTSGGWLLRTRRNGRDESTFHWMAFHTTGMLTEYRRMVRCEADRSEFGHTLVAALILAKTGERPESLDAVVWGAFTDLTLVADITPDS